MSLIGDHLPACPLKDAKRVKSTYYRLLREGKIELSCFKSRAELGIGNINKCEEHALSLTPTLIAAQKLREKFPHFKAAKIAAVQLTEEHGVVHQNRPDHANWWHTRGFDPTCIASFAD